MSSDGSIRFARWVFLLAGIIGLVEIVPLYFMESIIGRMQPPAIIKRIGASGLVSVTGDTRRCAVPAGTESLLTPTYPGLRPGLS